MHALNAPARRWQDAGNFSGNELLATIGANGSSGALTYTKSTAAAPTGRRLSFSGVGSTYHASTYAFSLSLASPLPPLPVARALATSLGVVAVAPSATGMPASGARPATLAGKTT